MRPIRDYAELLSALQDYDFDRRLEFLDRASDSEEEPIGDGGVETVGMIPNDAQAEYGDAVKTDGKCLYMLDNYGLQIVAAIGMDSQIRSYTPVTDWRELDNVWTMELFVHGSRVAVIYTKSGLNEAEEDMEYDTMQTHAVIFDVSDPYEPRILADFGLDGSYQTAFLMDGRLYLMTSVYLWSLSDVSNPEQILPRIWKDGAASFPAPEKIWLAPNALGPSLSLLAGISLDDAALTDTLCYSDSGLALLPCGDSLILGRSLWTCGSSAPRQEGVYEVTNWEDRTRTELQRIRLAADGTMQPETTARIDGAFFDPASLDVHNGVLRIITSELCSSYQSYTDTEKGFTNSQPGQQMRINRILTLDKDFRELGRLELLGEGAPISSSRLCGNYGWFVLADNQDEVQLFDLANPAAPKLGATLDLRSTSRLMQPLSDGTLLCCACEEPGEGIVLRRFNLSNPGAPVELGRTEMKNMVESQVTWMASALFVDEAAKRIGFPIQKEGKPEYVLFRYGAEDIARTGSLELNYIPSDVRALPVDGALYLCSTGMTYVLDPDDMQLLTTVTEAVG